MDEEQGERSYSKSLLKMKHDFEKKMRRSSQIFGLDREAAGPSKKEMKTEYMDKLQRELSDWSDFMRRFDKIDDPDDKIEVDEKILKSDQLIYCQSSVDTNKWLEESAAFRKKVMFYLHKTANLNELRKSYSDVVDTKIIERQILHLQVGKFDTGTTEELDNRG